VAAHPESETTHTPTETTESEQLSRLRRYDQRLDEWLTSLKDEAGQRSPEVLSALAAKAQDVADYLSRMAEKARSKNEASGITSSAEGTSRSGESAAEPDRDPGSSIT
jgi:hypothetical protein